MSNRDRIEARNQLIRALHEATQKQEQDRKAKRRKEEKNVSENKKRPGV